MATAALGQTFTATDAYDVRIVRCPCSTDLMTPRQHRLYTYWTDHGGGGAGLPISRFDPLEIRECIGYLHILQYDRDRDDFFYRIYGEAAATAAHAFMHRQWVLDHPGTAGSKFNAHYRDVMASGEPWLGEVLTVDRTHVAPYWNRIVLPLVDPDAPQGFVCVTMAEPEDRLPDRPTTLSGQRFAELLRDVS